MPILTWSACRRAGASHPLTRNCGTFTMDSMTEREKEFVEGIDWRSRLWPKAKDVFLYPHQGEWALVIRGGEEDFAAVHNALCAQGFVVNEDGDYEVYCKKELTNVNNLIDVW